MRHRLAEMGENSLTDSLEMVLILTNAPHEYENVVSAINMQMNTPIVTIQAPVAAAGTATLTAAQIASAALATEAAATVLASITGNEVSLKTVKTAFKDFWTAQKDRKGMTARHEEAFYAVAPSTTFRTPFAGKCHNCGQVGHLSRNCTNATVAGARESNMRDRDSAQGHGVRTSEKCGFCGIPGHMEADCRKKEAALAKLSGERTDGVLFVGCCSLVEKDTIDHTENLVTKPVFYNEPLTEADSKVSLWDNLELTETDSKDSFWDNFKVSTKGATNLGEELTKFYDWHHDETHWEPMELGEELEDKESTNLNDDIKELYEDYDHVEPTSTPTPTSIPIVLIGKEPCPLNKHLVHSFPEEKDESITLLVDGPTKRVPAPTYCTTKASLDGILELKSTLRNATDWRTRRTNDTNVDLRAVWSDNRDSPWLPPSKMGITPTTVIMDPAGTAMERPSPTPIILVVEPPTPIAPSTKTAVGNQDRDQKKPLFLKSQQQGNQDSGKICSNTILKGYHSTNATRLVKSEELVKDCPLLGRTVIHDLHTESNAGLRDILDIISMELEKVKQTRNNGPVISNLPPTETTDHEMSVLTGQEVTTHPDTTMRVMQPGVSNQVSIGITKRIAEAPTKRKLSSPTESPGPFKDQKILKNDNGNQGPVDMITHETARIKETSFPIVKGILGVPGPVSSGLLVRDRCHHPRLPRNGQVHGQHVKVPEQGSEPKMGSKLGITTRVATVSTLLVSKVTAPRLGTEPNVTLVEHPDGKAGRNGPIAGSIPETSLVQRHPVARASDSPGAMINMGPDSVRKQACDQNGTPALRPALCTKWNASASTRIVLNSKRG
jgi:Zinc knuckle